VQSSTDEIALCAEESESTAERRIRGAMTIVHGPGGKGGIGRANGTFQLSSAREHFVTVTY
jgi:hypothetical protein